MCVIAQMTGRNSVNITRLKASHKIVVSFVAATLLVVLAASTSLRTFRQVESLSEAQKYTTGLLVRAGALLDSLGNAERNQHAYSLTADERHLAAYLSERERIPVALEELRALTATRASRAHLDTMRPLVEAKLAQLRDLAELRRNEDVTAVAAAALATADKGRATSDAIRGEAAGFVALESAVLEQERVESTSLSDRMFYIILVICGLALLLPISFSYQIYEGTQSRIRDLVHVETQRLLEVQEDANRRLQQANTDLQASEEKLEAARSVADKANLAKSEFLSSMSHELRTPLSAILGFGQLIESGDPPPNASQKRSLDQILKAGWYLLDLINEILDLALIESGRLSLSMEPMSLASVMDECRLMVEPQAHARGIDTNFPKLPQATFVLADRTRIKQVLINLLSNAIKYNSAGGTIDVTCTLAAPRRVRVSVRDTGSGLSPAQLAQLFQPFNRLGQEQQSPEGTGIGLVMCKRLVELMGGAIGVESTVGAGSVFWIEVDASEELRPVIPPRLAVHAARLRHDGAPHERTLLYVEDNPANLMLVEDIIARRPDIRLLNAPDGLTGVRMALESLPDVILMDINLPGISGIEAMQILAADAATTHIPVVALSANAMPRDIAKGLEQGFFRYLTKPIKVAEFLDTLDLALEHATLATANGRSKP
jgi:signal transduction histidine kinase